MVMAHIPLWTVGFFGVGNIVFGAIMIYWSHRWRGHKMPLPFYVPSAVYHAGHLMYFAFGWVGFSIGIGFITGAFLNYLTYPLLYASTVAGAIMTIFAMSFPLRRFPQ